MRLFGFDLGTVQQVALAHRADEIAVTVVDKHGADPMLDQQFAASRTVVLDVTHMTDEVKTSKLASSSPLHDAFADGRAMYRPRFTLAGAVFGQLTCINCPRACVAGAS